ncbi:hypothetical protein CHS0354_007685 [Potamilus streckersoni]|uniref:Uncharacterized protein n=1 Tax=Potamilus streckersoni TaxID=2493646 RepID=A0AAE0SHJ4_9BIVA|nr:hypothetical protein CHS0354_007685 [Potamilus streckersoni]
MVVRTVDKRIVQCAIVGDGMVGKSTMALSFIGQNLPNEYVATVFENYAGRVLVESEQYTVSIFDSAGQHDYEGLRAYTYKDSEVYVICYSVVDRESFQNVREFWVPEAKSFTKRRKPIILVGTQTDLRNKINCEMDNVVTTEEGNELGKEIGAESFMECSSVLCKGVTEVFENTVLTALKYRKKKTNIFHKILGR